MKEALTNKYGPSNSALPFVFYRGKVLDKQASSACENSTFDWDTQPQGFQAACGQSFYLRLQNDAAAPQVFQFYHAWLLDHEAAAADAAQLQAQRQAQNEALNRKAQESAKSNKQAL